MENKKKQFYKELKLYSELGIHILLEDYASTPQEIYQTCIVCEDMPYMCDFVFKENDKLSEVHFYKMKKNNVY